jgi:hypothetical protein
MGMPCVTNYYFGHIISVKDTITRVSFLYIQVYVNKERTCWKSKEQLEIKARFMELQCHHARAVHVMFQP